MKKQKGDFISYEGYCIDLLNELARILNFTFEIHHGQDGYYGVKTENGTWNGMIGELVNEVCEQFDTCFDLNINTFPRSIEVPFIHFGYQVLVHFHEFYGNFGNFGSNNKIDDIFFNCYIVGVFLNTTRAFIG